MRRGPTSVPRTIVALGLCLAGACTVPVSTKPARSGHPTTTRVRATERPSPEHASTQEKHGAPTEEPEELYLGGNVDADLDPDVRLRAPGDDAMTPDEPLERNIDADPEVDVFVHPESGVPKSVEAGALPSTPALPVGDPVRVRASDAAREEPALACFRLAEASIELDAREATDLCTAAPGTGPATCALSALERRVVPRHRVVELCRCARSAAPAACYETARRTTSLDEVDITRLCGATARLGADCLPRDGWN